MKKANRRYLGKGLLFLAFMMVAEAFAIQEWAIAVGISSRPLLSLSLPGVIFTLVLFSYALIYGGIALSMEWISAKKPRRA